MPLTARTRLGPYENRLFVMFQTTRLQASRPAGPTRGMRSSSCWVRHGVAADGKHFAVGHCPWKLTSVCVD